MSNGLFGSDGIDLKALIGEHIGPRAIPAQLIKPGQPGGRDPDDPTKVLPDGPPQIIPCRGFIEDFSDFSVAQGLVKVGDRKITLIAATIRGGAEPDCGPGRDRIKIEGKIWSTHRLRERDPAGATYVIQARSPSKDV